MSAKIKNKIKNENQTGSPFEGRVGLVYARVSDKSQETHGTGRESQETRCKKDLESNGVLFERSFIDTYSGGGDFMRRPAMRALLAYIDANAHKNYVVVFDDLSRFARDVKFHLKLREEFMARDVILRCLNYNFDDSPEGEYVELVLAGANELQRKQNRRQVISRMKARLDAGYYPFARKRGYDIDKTPGKGHLRVPNQEGLEILKPALEDFAKGNLARKIDVARFLCERNFCNKWGNRLPVDCLDDVSDILTDPFYCGDVEYKDWGVKRMEGKHEGIITRDTFAQIQKRLLKDGSDAKPRKDNSDEFMLRGLLVCEKCAGHLTGAYSKGRTKRYRYYFCQSRGCELYYKSIPADEVEKHFRDLLRRNRLKPKVEKLAAVVFDKVWTQESQMVEWHKYMNEQKKTELKKKLKDLTNLAWKAKSDAVTRAYEVQMEEAAKDLEKAEGDVITKMDLSIPYRTALDKGVAVLKNPVSAWDLFDVQDQHRLFFFLFDAKLAYAKNEGYRTGDSLSTTRLFEEFVATNSDDVDRTGFEPATPSLQMRCSTTELTARHIYSPSARLSPRNMHPHHSPELTTRRRKTTKKINGAKARARAPGDPLWTRRRSQACAETRRVRGGRDTRLLPRGTARDGSG